MNDNLRRSRKKTLGGVCGGIAKFTNTDPVLWKLLFIIGALSPLPAILIYIIMWIVIPLE